MRQVCNMPTARTALLLFSLEFIFAADQVLSQLVQPTQRTDNVSTEVYVFGQDGEEGSGEVTPTMFNTTDFSDVETDDTLPHLVVLDAFGHPCFLATLNATMQVSYRVPEGIVHETYIALAEIQLPEDVHAQGVCGDNRTRLLLDWGNSTFQVNMTFSRNEPTTERENATWSLTDVDVTYALSKQDVFPGSSESDIVTVERQYLDLFTTPVGFTHECDLEVTVAMGPSDRGVVLHFHDVRIAAFGVTSSEFPSAVTVCTEEGQSQIQEEILIPLIVACCLSAIVVVIVIAYVISRKIQTSREQSEYKQMP